ncbi:MAG: TlyA family RNA methyltransferase [Firmicutes bacterium]|jgi:23S rRNA (cytidine1920-2'-O)/16S rRNA (cytidine1409-2'-O)-methyltransferase|nr:TlyA family RNA methyltransferase [Bacillota bacterium]
MVKKKRLDILAVDAGFFTHSRRARAEIMAGNVLVNGLVCDKPGTMVPVESEIALLPPENPYVGRGGLKIEGAARDLNFSFEGKVVLDAGASTGGFTDYALRHGAAKVYAVDVGYGQLDWKLRQDPRVINMERTNIRHLRREDLGEIPDIATVDLSFISLKKVIPVLVEIGIPEIVVLVKPQFEAARGKVEKGGVVRDPEVHQQVVNDIIEFGESLGLEHGGMARSRLKGPRGNLEFFLYFA